MRKVSQYSIRMTQKVGNQPAPLQRSLGPSGPEIKKKVSKMSPGASGPGTPKSLKKVSGTVREVSGESPESVWRVFLDCPRDFLETFWGPGAGGPGRHFRDFFGISGPEGPRDLCKGRAGSQAKGGMSLRGGSRHRRNRQNRQDRHGRLLALYFVGQAKGGQGALQNRQNRHEGCPP